MAIDATVIPLKKIISTLDFNINEDDKIKLTYTTNFGSEELSTSSYTQFTKKRHLDCVKLFDGYDTTLTIHTSALNIRWNATSCPAGSTWLYSLE